MKTVRALFDKYRDFIMEVIHFGMVGVINTLMGWGIMALLYNLIHMNYWLSSGISYFIGSVFSYHANAKLTFKVEERDKWLPWRFAINIIVCYLVSFSVAKPLVARLIELTGLARGGGLSQALFENIAMIFGMGIFIVMNFFGQKLFVFKTRKRGQIEK
ncbi:MAG: GtrA family protein [Lachnospiraceae bacterium]|nr:GtrA family protein [Lachnospiraceae bacterium]